MSASWAMLETEALMTDKVSGLKEAIELMEAALGRLIDIKDHEVAMRLSHAIDLAREHQSEQAV
jgi:hypothetical protein